MEIILLKQAQKDIVYRKKNGNKANEARKVLIKVKLLVKILPLDKKILELALSSDFKDFEDAIRYYTALENKLEIIITRNKKTLKHLNWQF